MTDDTSLQTAIAAERRELASMLGQLDTASWDAPSLCDGWRIREVVAHITMPFRYSTGQLLFEMAKARGNFDRMADRCARRDAAMLSADELVDSLEDNATHPWKPPGSGHTGALAHDIIHGLDITVALGVARRVPINRLRLVLDNQSPKSVAYFGADLEGIQLRANDLDWTYGFGAPLCGAAQDLLLVVCNRKLPAGRLSGQPSDQFTDR